VGGLERREYQAVISEAASKANTLVVLPTGLGKTIIAILVAESRLAELNGGKVVVLAPTRPLVVQHHTSFKNHFGESACSYMTGRVRPEERVKVWAESRFVFATPQVVANDVRADRYSLSEVCLMVFDEAHRCVKDYDYTELARRYQQTALHPLILGLTASPGGQMERVREICQNLFIKQVESRNEYDEDVRPYVQAVSVEWRRVGLSPGYRAISALLREVYDEKLEKLKSMRVIPDLRIVPKKLLLDSRQQLIARLRKSRSGYIFAALALQSQAISLLHAIELLETQDVENLRAYLDRMSENPKRTVKSLLKDQRIQRAISQASNLNEAHPKLKVASSLVSEQINTNAASRIIIFTQYRDTVDHIVTALNREGVRPVRFVGQATREESSKGLTQNEQVEILGKFKSGEYNVLVTTSIGEEGLHVPDVDHVIFYEAVPSEIRTIQRRGRTGRTRIGKVTVLMAEDTVDEAYYWSSLRKERRMHSILSMVRTRGVRTVKKRTTLLDYT
jgi:Fanconi anemia group M protein